MNDQTLGFVGVGKMGAPMVRRLIEAGHSIVAHDTSAESIAEAARFGATIVKSPAAVGDAAEIVFLSLPTPPIVEAVALSTDGVAHGKHVKIVIDTSTTGAIYARRVAAGLAKKGIIQVDAPVSGGVTGANKGSLAVMVACPEDILERLRPILAVIGRVFFLGTKPGMGHTMKLLNNILSAAAMTIASEAVVMGVKAGLDPHTMLDVINAGTGRNSATADKLPRLVLPRKFDGGFAVGLLNKDLRLCLEEADALGIPMVVGSAVKQLVGLTVASEGAGADMSEIIKTVEKWAGVEVKG